MKRLLLALLILSPTLFFAQERKVFNGFSGGMMLHLGYAFGNNQQAPLTPNGVYWGLGGAARINLFEHLRLGGEGYVSNMPSGFMNGSELVAGSYLRNGWGGLIIDSHWRKEKVWFYSGATIGGGALRSLYIRNGNQNDWQSEADATFNKQSYFCVVPFVGLDYVITQRVHATFKVDWQVALHKKELLLPTGPRVYVGILFCH